MTLPFQFRTPSQRNRSIVDQMGVESQRQRKMEEEEAARLKREMEIEIQRQKLREVEEQQRLQADFKVEQQRQSQFDERDSFRNEFSVEQRRQKLLDQQQAPRREEFDRGTPRFVDPTAPFFVEAERERREAPPRGPGLLEQGGRFALSQLEQTQREVLDPIAARGLQIAESPAGGGILGVTELKGAQRQLEDLGVPEDVSPFPREKGFEELVGPKAVDPFKAIAGNKEEQDKAQAVLEEAGLPRALASQVIFDPLNLLPGVGFTRVDDVAQLGRLVLNAAKGAPRARTALRESGQFQKLLRTVSEEAGGGTPSGLAAAKDRFGRLIDPLLPQGGIPGGFKPSPRIPAGTKVRGVNLSGKAVEGELIKADQGVGLVRETGTDIVKRISLEGMEITEEAAARTIGDRLRQVVRDVRLGPSPRTAVPSLDPTVQKFVKALRTAKPGIRSVRAERGVELSRRAGRVRGALEAEELTAREAGIESAKALKGELPRAPEFEVALEGGERGLLAQAFTPDEVENFVSMARLSPSLDDVPLTRKNIMDSLLGTNEKTGILFGRLPTPGELKNLEKVYGVELVEQFAKFAKFGDRAWRTLLDVLNIPRTLLASFDMSFPFRQGLFAAVRHPKEFWGNLPAMLRAAKNREFAEQMVRATKNDRTLIETADGLRPTSELLEEGKVFLPDITGLSPLEERPEEILSQIARRIPGVTISERAFIPIGNNLRASIFKNTLKGWARHGKPATAEEIADLGLLVNVLTGRGNLPRSLAKNLSFGWFAPRFAVSRPQLFLAAILNAIPGVRTVARPITSGLLGSPGATNRVANLAAQELVSTVAAGIGILTLAKMSGVAEVNLDPRSSDFGKLKIGNERIDFWGGARPWATFVARAITGKTATATGFVLPASFMDTLLRFGRSKLSPPGAILVDVIVGETAIGEGIGGTGDILRRTIPLAIQDIFEAVNEEGLTAGIIALPAFVGVGVQTYETASEIKKRVFEETFPGREYQATSEDNAIVRDAIAEGNNKAALEAAFQPSAAQMKTEEARVAEATELGLFTLAHAVNRLEGMGIEEILATGSEAGPEFIDAWEDYKDRVSGAVFEATFGKDRRGTPEYLAWRDIKLRRDSVTQAPLWDEYFEAKDAALARLDPLLQKALERVRVPGNDPALRRTVEAYETAREIRRESFNLPRWIGIDAERSKEITEVQRLAAAKNRELAAQGSPDVPSEVIYELVGIDIGDAALARQAWFVRSGSSASRELRDPRRDQLLVDNTSILFRFFPELYREELLNVAGELERVGA